MANDTMKVAVQEAVSELSHDVLAQLSVEQLAALESKFMTLPIEVRSACTSKYPQLSFAGAYIARQAVKEANGKLASQKRPGWYIILDTNARSLSSSEQAIREYSERMLRDLAESIDGKEATMLLKKYKTAHDTTTKDAHIMQLCGIFGVSPTAIA
jgi:hypothetical protein